jgi:hypothetical protein
MHWDYYIDRRLQCKTQGQEWALFNWWRSLSHAEQERLKREHRKKYDEEQRLYMEQIRATRQTKLEEKRKHNEKMDKQAYVNNRNPNSLGDGEAVTLWLVVMAVGTIFKGNWFIWIIATLLLIRHFTYESRREWEWENGGKEKYYQNIKNACKGDK